MLSCTVPTGVRKVADRYKSLFTDSATNYAALCAFLALHLYGCNTLSELARTCPWSPSVSELSRAVKGWNASRFMRRMRASVLRRYNGKFNPSDFCYAVDDTANPKFGKGIAWCGNWHSSAGPFHGQKVLVIVLVERRRGIAIPIHYAFGRKEGTPDYKSMPDLTVDLLAECRAMGFPPLPVTCDSWFDSAPLMGKLEDLGLSYDGEIKSSRLVRGNPGPNVVRTKLKPYFAGHLRYSVPAKPYGERAGKKKRRGAKKRKWIAETTALINGRKKPLKLIAVYNHRDDKDAFAYYVSTNRSMSGAELWSLARSRWAIEVLFRDMKQNLSFGRLPCTGEEAADLAVCVPFALIVSLRLDDPEVWGLNGSSDDSIGTKIVKIREQNLQKALALITFNPGHQAVDRLRNRRRVDNVNRKPVNKAAAGDLRRQSLAASAV